MSIKRSPFVIKCGLCNVNMEKKHVYILHYDEIDEDIAIKNVEYDECPICHRREADIRIVLDLYNKSRKRFIEKWLFRKIRSFEEITRWFYSKEQAIETMLNYAKKHGLSGVRFDKEHLNEQLKNICFCFRMCGQEFFLKASVHQYCVNDYQAGLWPLKEGYHDEWANLKNVRPIEKVVVK